MSAVARMFVRKQLRARYLRRGSRARREGLWEESERKGFKAYFQATRIPIDGSTWLVS